MIRLTAVEFSVTSHLQRPKGGTVFAPLSHAAPFVSAAAAATDRGVIETPEEIFSCNHAAINIRPNAFFVNY